MNSYQHMVSRFANWRASSQIRAVMSPIDRLELSFHVKFMVRKKRWWFGDDRKFQLIHSKYLHTNVKYHILGFTKKFFALDMFKIQTNPFELVLQNVLYLSVEDRRMQKIGLTVCLEYNSIMIISDWLLLILLQGFADSRLESLAHKGGNEA